MGRVVIVAMVILGVIVGILTATDTVDNVGTLGLIFAAALLVIVVTSIITARRRKQRT